MSVLISEIELAGKESAVWQINNWKDDFEILKSHARCSLDVKMPGGGSKPVQVIFSFKAFQETEPQRHKVTDTWLSLEAMVHLNRNPPVLISVDANSNAKSTTDIQGARFVVLSGGYSPDMVEKKFIHLTHKEYDSYGTERRSEEYIQPNQLRINITAKVFNFRNGGDKEEEEEGETLKINRANQCSIPETRPFITATENLNLLYGTEQDFSILKLATKDNVTLTGHRFIMAAKSPVLGKIIEDNVSDNGFSGTVQMGTVNAKPLLVVLHWMYTGAVHENATEVMEEIVEMCVAFQIPELLKILDEKLIKICSTENMFRLFQVAQKNGMKSAMRAISDFIKKNIGNVATA